MNTKLLTGSQLKMIAMISMLVDHLAKGIFLTTSINIDVTPIIYAMIIMGRIAYPIFCYLLVEGFVHTSNRGRYLMNILIFAIVTEIPFNLMLAGDWRYPDHQNILWTFTLALLVLVGVEYFLQKDDWTATLVAGLIVASGCLIAEITAVDYGYLAILTIVALFYFHEKPFYGLLVGIALNFSMIYASLGFLLCTFYNGQRGHLNKWVGYVFYPLHLILIYAVQVLTIRSLG